MTQVDIQVQGTANLTPRDRREVSGPWALGAGLAWVAALQVMYLLEPAATRPDAMPAFLMTAMTFTMNLGLLAMTVGLVRRARWAFSVSAAVAMLNVGAVVACPVSGHHALGSWWFAQVTLAVGLVVLSFAGWRASVRAARS